MKKVIAFIFAAIVSLSGSAAFADSTDPVTPSGFGVAVGAWVSPNFSGTVKGGSGGTEMSFNHNLGFTGQTIIVPNIYYRWDHGQILDVRYDQYNQTVTQTLTVPETFQGASYPAGSSVMSNTKLEWAEVSYEMPIAYDKFPPQDHFFNLLAEIEALRASFTINNSNNVTLNAPFPLLGFHGKFRVLPNTSLEFKAAGIRAGFVDSIRWEYNFEAGINQTFLDNFTITAKYRYATFYNRDAEDNRLGFRIYGPEVDAGFHF